MALNSKHIIVVNEYTIKGSDGRGSRGSSPSNYVLHYMARYSAIENVTPIKRKEDDSYIVRYNARKSIVEDSTTLDDVKYGLNDYNRYGGIAFSNDTVSLSYEKLYQLSHEIEDYFDKGKTVLKTVISFSDEYLKNMNVVPSDIKTGFKGCYRGNLDEIKLRLAIMHGLSKMKGYDDLMYVGVIQVDTKNVHCHLAMVDKGIGTIMPDGTQKGKLSSASLNGLRKGINDYLQYSKPVKLLYSNVDYDKRNVLCYTKRFTHKVLETQGDLQFLIACLPPNRKLWRAGSNAKSMKKANSVTKDYVYQVLSQPDSGYDRALNHINEYVNMRKKKDNLSKQECVDLYNSCEERLINDCINSVYSVVKQIPLEEYSCNSPFMSSMSLPKSTLYNSYKENDTNNFLNFSYKLRSYSTRLSSHKKDMHKYRDLHTYYNNLVNANDDVTVNSNAYYLLAFLQNEYEYNAKCMCKYQYFLSFLPLAEEYQDDFIELVDYNNKVNNMMLMMNDNSIKHMKYDNAEEYGLKVYGLKGGGEVSISGDINSHYERMQIRLNIMKSDFEKKLADYGLTLKNDDEKGFVVSYDKPYAFDDVKSLDLHHLSQDFISLDVSEKNINIFKNVANKRYELFKNVETYLINSNQAYMLRELPVDDINLMKDVADALSVSNNLSDCNKIIDKNNKDVLTDDINYETEETLEESDSDYYNRGSYGVTVNIDSKYAEKVNKVNIAIRSTLSINVGSTFGGDYDYDYV